MTPGRLTDTSKGYAYVTGNSMTRPSSTLGRILTPRLWLTFDTDINSHIRRNGTSKGIAYDGRVDIGHRRRWDGPGPRLWALTEVTSMAQWRCNRHQQRYAYVTGASIDSVANIAKDARLAASAIVMTVCAGAPAGSTFCPKRGDHQWADYDKGEACIDCVYEAACDGTNTCLRNHKGYACGACEPNYFLLNEKCRKCPKWGKFAWVFAGIFAAIACFLIYRHGIRQRGLDAHLYDPHDQRHALPSYVHLLVVQHRVPRILCASRQVANCRLFV